MAAEYVTKNVRLLNVDKPTAQQAVVAIEDIFDAYELSDEVRYEVWKNFQAFATNVLIEFGEFDPDVGYSERNGHY